MADLLVHEFPELPRGLTPAFELEPWFYKPLPPPYNQVWGQQADGPPCVFDQIARDNPGKTMVLGLVCGCPRCTVMCTTSGVSG